MGLESATYISNLVATNPVSSDQRKQGDDHIRLVKAAAQATFPNADRPFRFPEFLAKSANYSVLAADDNKTILCDTTSEFTLTLPTPTFDGWFVKVVKGTTDVNPVYVAPPSGTINGFAKIRINVPYVEYLFVWTGSVFLRVSPFGTPAGVSENFHGATAPVGFALCYGQTLTGSAADYPELNSALGGIVLPDLRGVVEAGKDDMGGSDAARLGSTTLGALVGTKTKVLVAANLPPYTPSGTVTGTFSGSGDIGASLASAGAFGGDFTPMRNVGTTTVNVSGNISATFAGAAQGGTSDPVNVVQATRVVNKIIRLC